MSPINVMVFVSFAVMGVESFVCVCVRARCEMEGEQTSAETDIKCFTVWCSEPAPTHPPTHPPEREKERERDRGYCKNITAPAAYYFTGLTSS